MSRLFILTTPATYHFFLLLFHQLFQHTSLNTLLQPISQSNTLHFLLPILPITFLVLLLASFLSILSLSWYHFKRSTPQDSIIITIADRIEEEMKEDALKQCQKEWDLLDSLIRSIASLPCFHQTNTLRTLLALSMHWLL